MDQARLSPGPGRASARHISQAGQGAVGSQSLVGRKAGGRRSNTPLLRGITLRLDLVGRPQWWGHKPEPVCSSDKFFDHCIAQRTNETCAPVAAILDNQLALQAAAEIPILP